MSDDFAAVHDELRAIMLRHGAGKVVARDEPGDLVVRTAEVDPKTGEPGWFGTVTVKKSYVAYHLMPLYARPELAEGLSPELARRRQGKTCFNFKRPDPALFAELEQLTEAAAR
jgi:hypothetical protein